MDVITFILLCDDWVGVIGVISDSGCRAGQCFKLMLVVFVRSLILFLETVNRYESK